MVAFTNIPNIILSIILIAYFRNALLLFRAKKRRYNNFFMNGYGHAVKKIQHHKQNRRNYGHLILTVKCLWFGKWYKFGSFQFVSVWILTYGC